MLEKTEIQKEMEIVGGIFGFTIREQKYREIREYIRDQIFAELRCYNDDAPLSVLFVHHGDPDLPEDERKTSTYLTCTDKVHNKTILKYIGP